NPPGAILPMGGAQAYKGFGLSLMIEILTGALSGGNCAKTVPYPKKGNCVFMLLIEPARFGGADHFQSEVTQLTEYVKACPRVEGLADDLGPPALCKEWNLAGFKATQIQTIGNKVADVLCGAGEARRYLGAAADAAERGAEELAEQVELWPRAFAR